MKYKLDVRCFDCDHKWSEKSNSCGQLDSCRCPECKGYMIAEKNSKTYLTLWLAKNVDKLEEMLNQKVVDG